MIITVQGFHSLNDTDRAKFKDWVEENTAGNFRTTKEVNWQFGDNGDLGYSSITYFLLDAKGNRFMDSTKPGHIATNTVRVPGWPPLDIETLMRLDTIR